MKTISLITFGKIGLTVFVGSILVQSARASVSLTQTFTFSQSFDSLGITSSTALFPNSGNATALTGSTGFDGAKIGGSSTTGMNFAVDNGGANGGAIYSYGTTGAADRALGSLASGTQIGAFGVVIVNNSGSILSGFSLSFNQEQYRNPTTTTNTTAFAYGTTAQNGTLTQTNYLLSSSTLIGIASGNLISTGTSATQPTTTNPSQVIITSRSVVISGISVGLGDSIYFRWSDADEAGSDAGLAIDDLSFTASPASPVPEPTTILGGIALLGLISLRERRRFTAWKKMGLFS